AAVLRTGHAAPSAKRLDRRVDSGLARHRASPAIGRGRDIDHPRIDLGHSVIAETEAFDRAGPHVLYKYGALFDDFERDRAVRLFLQVQLDHRLVVIRGNIKDGIPFDLRRHHMRQAIAAWRFDLDYVGTERAQQLGRPWPDRRDRKI